MIAIVDYGVGNLFSLKSSLQMLGESVTVSGDPAVLAGADALILPGVGAFGDAREKLACGGLDREICAMSRDKPMLGICLGMQMLFEESEEFGIHRGLGLLPGRVTAMEPRLPRGTKIPAIGWSELHLVQRACPIFEDIAEGDCVYFVHSYSAVDCGDALAATTDYGIPVTAAAARGHIFGTQFHPEKSGRTGLAILAAFCRQAKGREAR